MAHGPYSRVYHELAEDYPEVYDGPLLADFVRLLIAADQAYPTRAKWRGLAGERAIARLAAIGTEDGRGALVILEGNRYSVRGIEKERALRSQKASNAAAVRWHSTSNAPSNASALPRAMPSRVEKRREENGAMRPEEARAALDSLKAVLDSHGLSPSTKEDA